MKRSSKTYLGLFLLTSFIILTMAACLGGSQAATQTEVPAAVGPQPTATRQRGDDAPPSNAQAGELWTSPKDGTVVVYVPAGDFLMGAREFDEDAEPDEMPMRTVTLDAYWIDRTEVTNTMFAEFLTQVDNQTEGGAPWLEASSPDARMYVEGPRWVVEEGYDDKPVAEVTWFGAQAYCEWAGRSLPTEAQWEKAARGTEGLIYPWGNTKPNCSLANYFTGSQACAEGLADVGTYNGGASPYGVFDMAGNVWEWVADWYKDNYYKNAPAENPTGPDAGSTKVFRGGSFESGPRTLRTSERNTDSPGVARYRIGFRCVLNP